MGTHEKAGYIRTVSLVRAAQEGDLRAREQLFSRYLPRVRVMVALRMRKSLRQILDLDDLVQDCLLRVLKDLDRFEDQAEQSFYNWVAKCVEREVIDCSRRHQAKKRGAGRVRRFSDYDTTVLICAIFKPAPTPTQVVRSNELAERIVDALIAVPKHDRELIGLRQFCGMSYQEIAQELGLKEEATARKAVSRARRKLAEMVFGKSEGRTVPPPAGSA